MVGAQKAGAFKRPTIDLFFWIGRGIDCDAIAQPGPIWQAVGPLPLVGTSTAKGGAGNARPRFSGSDRIPGGFVSAH